MKHLFKLNKLAIFFLLISFLLSGCSKDEHASPSSDMSKMYGRWGVTGIYKNGENIMSDKGNSEVVLAEISDMHKDLHNAEGAFAAILMYKSDFSTYSTTQLMGYCKLTSSNIMRITMDFETNPYEIKIKNITTSKFNFEYEDQEMGWLEIHCDRIR